MSNFATGMRWAGGVGIVTIAVMRCAIVFASQVVFETDPATDPVPLAGLAMGGSLWLDVALLLACAVALSGEWAAKRGINWFMLLLALVPFAIVAVHGSGDLADMWRGSTWAAAMVAAVTLAHLARERQFRIVLASLLVGAVAFVAVRGVAQVTFEHAETVREFEQTKDRFLSERGWSPDSAAARIFERRLRQPQPTGWFPTTNIFGSLVAFGLIAWGGWTICAVRARLQSGWPVAMGLLALACAVMLLFTGSKGAILAAMLGAGLAISPLMFAGVRRVFERWGSAMCVGFVALTLIAIVIRGTVLPESFAGDKSLLFRWHYLIASARMFAANILTGVGPDGYQDAYTQFRVPRNPEEVQSAHSVFADWLSTLGIAGAAWVALTLLLAWRSGASLASPSSNAAAVDGHSIMRRTLVAAGAVMLLGLVPAISVEWAVMDEASLRVRCIGSLVFIIAAVVSSGVIARVEARFANWVFAAAAMAVLVHGQIEMTFHCGGSAVWAMCVLGVAGQGLQTGQRFMRPVAIFAVSLLAVLAALLEARGVFLAEFGDRIMTGNASMLQGNSVSQGANCETRTKVAESLQLNAGKLGQTDSRLAIAAAQQFLLAAEQCSSEGRANLVGEAVKALEDAMTRFDRQVVIVAGIGAHARLAALTSNQAQWNRAIELATEITQRDPHGMASWRNLGDVLWAAGRHEEAAAAYERALQNNANFELDELKQLSDRDREFIQTRIKQARKPLQEPISP